MGVLYLKCQCPHCGVNIEFPHELSGRDHDCPSCGQTVKLLTELPAAVSPSTRKRPHETKKRSKAASFADLKALSEHFATENQLRRLAAHGRLEDRDYSRAEARSIISPLADSPEWSDPDWSQADAQNGLIRRIRKRCLGRVVKEGRAVLQNANLEPEKAEEAKEIIAAAEDEFDVMKDDVEAEREQRADERMLIGYYQDQLGAGGEWSHVIKRPTQQQIRRCFEALNRGHPDWEQERGLEPLVATLIANYPELKTARPSAARPSGAGCVVLFLMIILTSVLAAALIA